MVLNGAKGTRGGGSGVGLEVTWYYSCNNTQLIGLIYTAHCVPTFHLQSID